MLIISVCSMKTGLLQWGVSSIFAEREVIIDVLLRGKPFVGPSASASCGPEKGAGAMSHPIAGEDGSLPLSAAGRVDARCDRFEEAWIAGQTPQIEDFLAGAAEPERPALLQELVRLEVEYRRRRGEDPKPLEYRQRFPEHADRIEALFGPSPSEPVGEPVPPPPASSPVPESDRGTWSEE